MPLTYFDQGTATPSMNFANRHMQITIYVFHNQGEKHAPQVNSVL